MILEKNSFRARDCSGNTAKAGALGHRERQSDRQEATARDHEPHGQRLRSCSGKPDGEHSEPGRPKNYNNFLYSGFYVLKCIHNAYIDYFRKLCLLSN